MVIPWNVVDVDELAAFSCQDEREANVFCCHFCHIRRHLLRIRFVNLQIVVVMASFTKRRRGQNRG